MFQVSKERKAPAKLNLPLDTENDIGNCSNSSFDHGDAESVYGFPKVGKLGGDKNLAKNLICLWKLFLLIHVTFEFIHTADLPSNIVL